ncbi:MAG TPA: lipopolysaccharide biosynthesis protein [Actinomycetota bacterium]|nr:lipopolysaccharide biosynthesis protein [Actinomycetota bacterium]
MTGRSSGARRFGPGTRTYARSRRGSVAKLSGATLAPTVLAALTGPIVARVLGPAGRGQVAAVVVYAAALPVVLSFGVPLAIGQRAVWEPDRRPALVSAALVLAALTIPFTVAGTWLIMVGPLHTIGGWARFWAVLNLLFTPASEVGLSFQALLQAEGALGPLAKVRAIPLVVSALTTLGFFALHRLTVATDLAGNLAAGAAAALATVIYVRDRPRGRYPLRPLLGFGARGFGWNVANMANARLDQILMAPYLASAQIGIYAVAVALATVPIQISGAVTARSFGEVGASSQRGREAARYMRLTALVLVGCCLAVAAPAPWLIPLVFGHAYRATFTPLLLLLPGSLALGLSATAASTLVILNKPQWPTWAEVAGLVVTVAGLAVFLRPFGIVAASAVSSVAYGATLAWNVRFLRRLGVVDLAPRWADCRWLRNRVLQVVRPSHARA